MLRRVQPNASQPPPPPAAKTEAPANSAPKLETPDAPSTKPNLMLPKSSSNPLRDTLQNLSRNSARWRSQRRFLGARTAVAPGRRRGAWEEAIRRAAA